MHVVMIAPGYPSEMPLFTQALAAVGARVFGVADIPEEELPELARRHLAGYLHVPSLRDEGAVVEAVRRWTAPIRVDRVECLWEPGVLLAARLREALGAAGQTLDEAVPFRDKVRMKQVLSAAGIRTPHHARVTSADECWTAAGAIGFPLILKPLDGAGSTDTYRVNDASELAATWPRVAHLGAVNVEEFVDGEEFTFDTVCVDGRIEFYSVSWYRPRPLVARTEEWISPQIVFLRDPDAPELAAGCAMGRAVLEALRFRTGFTHMEWYRKANGEVVFGEIAARPPGARSVDAMNYASDVDLFAAWAEAVVHRRFTQPVERRYNSVLVFKRAEGGGHIQRVEGLDELLARFGPHIATLDLLAPGEPRRDWRQTLLSDGWVVVRHPELREALRIADAVGTDVRIYAG
jgi:biotin carboxylase